MTEYVYIVKERGETKAFSTFEKAIAYVSPMNYKAGMRVRFQMEDERLYDKFMDECLGNMWVDHSVYEQWRKDKLFDMGLTEQDLKDYTEVLLIETVEVE